MLEEKNMIVLNSTSLKDKLSPGVFDAYEFKKQLDFMCSYQKLCQDLLNSKSINNVSILMTIDNDFKLNVSADFLNEIDLVEKDSSLLVEQLVAALSDFHNEYDSVIDSKIKNGRATSVSSGFRKVLNSYSKLSGVNTLKIADQALPAERIDKTVLRCERELFDAPDEGFGIVEIFDYNDMCISITPDDVDDKRFKSLKVFCTLEQNYEISKLRYSDKVLYGQYSVEMVDERLNLLFFRVQQISLNF